MGARGKWASWVLCLGVMIGSAPLAAWAAEGAEKPAVVSNLSAQLYGYIRLDVVYDTGRIYPGNYALWVKSDSLSRGDEAQLNITANQTRLGVNLTGPEVGGAKTSGKIEFDFYGPATGVVENKALIMMRHAYAELYWPECDFGILAGQTWDVVSPLSPDTVNFLVCSMAGEIGYRRPQLRLTQGIGVGEKAKIVLKAAAAREISDLPIALTGLTYKEGPYPAVQASVAYTAPLFTAQPVYIGLSALWGKEEYDATPTGWVDFPLWAISADLALPLVDGFTLKANAWRGTDLDSYLGGILQGVNALRRETINSQGGWVFLGLGPWSDMKFNLGAGIDAPQADQLPADPDPSKTSRQQNSVGFANVMCSLAPFLQLGVEISYWRTLYVQAQEGNSLRYQSALTYSF